MRHEVITRKLIGYAEKIIEYTDGCVYEEFVSNAILVEACVFNLSQMGELANRLDRQFIDAHPEIPWKAIYGLRNRIVHDYDGVNLTLVWDIIRGDLPVLITQLKELP